MKTLPYGAKLEAIKKAMKTGQKFYLHTYLGNKEVMGIDMYGSWATTGNLNNNTLRSWAICSTHVDTWYSQLAKKDRRPRKAKSVSARSFFRGVPGRGVDY